MKGMNEWDIGGVAAERGKKDKNTLCVGRKQRNLRPIQAVEVAGVRKGAGKTSKNSNPSKQDTNSPVLGGGGKESQ